MFHVDSHDQGKKLAASWRLPRLRSVFKMRPFHFAVPDYEVVNFRSVVRRDAERGDIRHVDLSAFGTR